MQKSSPHTYVSLCHRLHNTRWNIVSVDLKFLKIFVSFQASALKCRELQNLMVLCISSQNYKNHDLQVRLSFWLHLASKGISEMIFVFYMCINQRNPNMMLLDMRSRMRVASTYLTPLASHCLGRSQLKCIKQNQAVALKSQ